MFTTTFTKYQKTMLHMLFYCTTILVLASSQLLAQDSSYSSQQIPRDPGSAKIMVVAKPAPDKIILRWAPSTPHAWRLGNRIGYVVERLQEGQATVRLTDEPVHPWAPDRMLDSLDARKEDFFLVTALQALWGDTSLIGMADSLGQDTIGIMAEKNLNLYSLSLFGADNEAIVADAMGLRFVDNTVKAGERYTYRIYQTTPRDYKIDTGTISVIAQQPPQMLQPDSLTAKGLDKRINLRWVSHEKNDYTGYFVSRSDDDGRTYIRMNSTPIVMIKPASGIGRGVALISDTLIINYKHYHYRVQGIDAFGELGPAAEIEAFGRDLTAPPMPMINQPELIGISKVKLTWKMPSEVPDDFSGFIIERSTFADSAYHRLTSNMLSKSTFEFVDNSASEDEPYYIVAALDTAGNTAPSFPVYGAVIDTTPPSIPTGLTGTVDTSGIVRLHWNRNPEKRILGYRILRANALEHEFTQVANEICRDTAFVDTIETNTLTDHIYYQIAAVNNHYNHSFASPPVGMRRPDKVPPVSPVFSDAQATEFSVMLNWVPSNSEDVKSQNLYRRTESSGQWATLASLPVKTSSYIDTAVSQSTMYEYLIEAEDSSGLRSPAQLTVQARPYDTGVRQPATNVKAVFNDKDSLVTISWEYTPAKQETFYFVIFRSVAGAPMRQYKSVDSIVRNFMDTDLVLTGVYEYAIKVMTESGAESNLSEKAQVGVSVR